MLEIRFRFDGKCRTHPRYNPKEHGRPTNPSCPGCESLYVIFLYTGIAERKAQGGDGIETSHGIRTQPGPDQPAASEDDHDQEMEQQVDPGAQELLRLELEE